MTRIDRFVHCKKLPDFEETLWEWIHLCDRYTRLLKWEDAPWWYNETASVGIFAGAIWRSGGMVLSDFATKRFDAESPVSKSSATRDKSRHGRCDLYFRLDHEEFSAEAKQVWSPCGIRIDAPNEAIEEYLEDARSQLQRLDEQWMGPNEKRIALAFVSPYVNTSYKDQMDDLLETWTQHVQKLDYAALAWVFPPEARLRLEDKDANRYYPGAALIIREIE